MVRILLLLAAFVIATAESHHLDLVASESVAADHKVQAVASAKYGYPHMIAPTLGPQIQARSDNEPLQAKSYGARSEDSLPKKKATSKPLIRRHDEAERPSSSRSYREPGYRNLEQLEDSFQPRRMDLGSPYYYSEFVPKQSHHHLSPRDPYLSPSKEPVDTFYPSSPKVKSYSSPSGYGTRNPGRNVYGAGHFDDSIRFHDEGHGAGGYGASPAYGTAAGPSSTGYRPYQSGHNQDGGYQDYEIKSNEPIMGNIRKKLLDYAGASDLYDGEPDYLQELSRGKHKYGGLGSDYFAYAGTGYQDRYRDFPYVESKISLVKKSRRV